VPCGSPCHHRAWCPRNVDALSSEALRCSTHCRTSSCTIVSGRFWWNLNRTNVVPPSLLGIASELQIRHHSLAKFRHAHPPWLAALQHRFLRRMADLSRPCAYEAQRYALLTGDGRTTRREAASFNWKRLACCMFPFFYCVVNPFRPTKFRDTVYASTSPAFVFCFSFVFFVSMRNG
jgi:hypothetical protein